MSETKKAKNIIDTIVERAAEDVYDLNDDLVNRLEDLFEEALRDNDWHPDDDAVSTIVGNSITNKQRLRCILSRHPDWSEWGQSITIPVTEKRNGDGIEEMSTFYRVAADWILCHGPDEEVRESWTNQVEILKNAIAYFREYTITDGTAENLRRNGYAKARKGQKTSRAVNAWAKGVGFDKHESYNKLFAELSDGLNSYTLTRKSIISINPTDILLMAHGNSWDSCHHIGQRKDKCHQAGPLSYIQDSTSFIFYTVDENCTEVHFRPKINRQMYHFHDGLLIQARLYPDYMDTGLGDTYRDVVQRILAACLDVPNRWITYRSTRMVSESVYTVKGSTHYPDYDINNSVSKDFLCTLSTIRDVECADELDVGHVAVCIECGHEHRAQNKLLCHNCNDEGYCEEEDYDETYGCCMTCDRDIDTEDDAFYIESGNGPFCENCVFSCAKCDCRYKKNEGTEIDGEDYCENCVSEHFTFCENCNEYVKNNKAVEVVVPHPEPCIKYCTEYWCEDCIDSDGVKRCEECGHHHTMETCECQEEKPKMFVNPEAFSETHAEDFANQLISSAT